MTGLIIVEDELQIREGIACAIDWVSHGLIVKGVAADGCEGFALYQAKRPQIVITDIRMPNMDGFAMVERIRAADPKVKFIVMSGYSEFEYIKKAMENKVSEFILKPVMPRELLEAVLKLNAEYIRETVEAEQQLRFHEYVRRSIKLLKNSFFENLTTAETVSVGAMMKRAEFLEIGLAEDGRYVVALLEPDNFGDATGSYPEQNRQMLLKLVEDEIDDTLLKSGESWQVREGVYGVMFVSKNGPLYDSVSERVEAVKSKLQAVLGISVTAALSDEVRGIENIPLAFAGASESLKYKVLLGNGYTIEYNDIKYMNKIGAESAVASCGEILKAMRSTDKGEVESAVEGFLNDTFSDASPDNIEWLCTRAIFALFSELAGEGWQEAELDAAFHSLYEDLRKRDTIDSIKRSFKETVSALAEGKQETNSFAVRRIIAYLNQNYAEKLSLQRLSEEAYLSSSHLCRVFKQEMGVNIGDYLVSIRIQKTKEFLCDTKYKVYEIANMVGYSDSRFFGNLFRRHTGVTLTEYRKKYC